MELKRAERRYNLSTADYAQLAAFRHALRRFLRFSETAAADVGINGQHYQALLIVRAAPDHSPVTIAGLAQQLLVKHNTAVELVDRLARQDLVQREPSTVDRRKVELGLTPRGRQLLARLAAAHRRELQRIGPTLKHFFAELSKPGR